MTEKAPTTLVSYSWDSEEHKNWVIHFANTLRGKGIDAKIDRFITQETTVNLNQMMIEGIRDNDYVIIVLTENYAKKANNFEGGVGFETILTLPLLQQNLGKLVFVTRHKGNFGEAFPFHLQGYYAINFSRDEEYSEKIDELLHRIYKEPYIEMAPLGPRPNLKPKTLAQSPNTPKSPFSDIEFPNLQKITDRDRMAFLRKSFQELCEGFTQLFQTLSQQNPSFAFENEVITAQKQVFWLYLNDNLVSGVKLWIGSLGGFGSSQVISLAYGRMIDPNHDSMSNEMITLEEVNLKLRLKMTMNMFGGNPENVNDIVKEIWKNHLAYAFR